MSLSKTGKSRRVFATFIIVFIVANILVGNFASSAQVGGTMILEIRVAASSDDAEERADGSFSTTSSDLEMVFDRGGNQLVGMRFNGITIPAGSTIVDAYVQFEADEVSIDITSLIIEGEATVIQ